MSEARDRSHEPLLPSGVDVAFADIDTAQERLRHDRRRHAPAPASIATVVAVGERSRLGAAADALMHLSATAGVRAILIACGKKGAPRVRVAEHAILIDGVKPPFLNNAVAALRLSSLPTMVWWRGGASELLDGLASLADRLVLDVEDPRPVWPLVPQLTERTAVTDLRWTRLTRWRALMAHFFDIMEIRGATESFHTLRIEAADVHAARLFGGWLVESLRLQGKLVVEIQPASSSAAARGTQAEEVPIDSITLGAGDRYLTLRIGASRSCVSASAAVPCHAGASRTVSLGDQGLAALVGEELRIRSRDTAFERAVAALSGLHAGAGSPGEALTGQRTPASAKRTATTQRGGERQKRPRRAE